MLRMFNILRDFNTTETQLLEDLLNDSRMDNNEKTKSLKIFSNEELINMYIVAYTKRIYINKMYNKTMYL